MKVLITGATGFIGGHLLDHLISLGFSVRCLVRDASKANRLQGKGVEIVVGDISDIESLNGLCRDIDYVFHAAALVDDWGSWDDFEKNTVLGTRNMLAAATRENVSRFIHISSVDVYDRKYLGSDKPRANETTPLVHDHWPYYYARAKMLAEREVFDYYNRGDLAVTVIRPATAYGAGDHVIMPKLIDFLRELSFWITNYNPVVGLIHVDDLAKLCVKAVMSDKSIGQAYNASSDEDICLKELVGCICAALKIAVPKHHFPYWLTSFVVKVFELCARLTNTRPIFDCGGLEFLTLDQRFDITKAKVDFDWTPEVNFEIGFQLFLNSVQKEAYYGPASNLPRIQPMGGNTL